MIYEVVVVVVSILSENSLVVCSWDVKKSVVLVKLEPTVDGSSAVGNSVKFC